MVCRDIIVHFHISQYRRESGQLAAAFGAERIRQAISKKGIAYVTIATGASQLEMLEALRQEEIPWNKVIFFHLDEYIGLPMTHPASFRKYLWERFHRQLPVPPLAFHYVSGEGDPADECQRLGDLISKNTIDVCFAGIGENAHLAFNDPPANFEIDSPFVVVKLDKACRQQQLGEGWFRDLDEVPSRAISMSIRQILKADCVLITAPDTRKAQAVRDSVEGPVSPEVPSSILQKHKDVHLFLDQASSALLTRIE